MRTRLELTEQGRATLEERLTEERRRREEAERDELRRSFGERPSLRGLVLFSIVAALAAVVLVVVFLGLLL